MLKRKFGGTDIDISVIGLGGFHLVETPYIEVERILNKYLDEGGNYIETAAMYGDGYSEVKIGKAISSRRNELLLATKTHVRDKKGATLSLEKSLKNLETDYVDVFFIHEPMTRYELDKVFDQNGTLQAAIEAKDKGKTRFIGISGHGYPETLINAFDKFKFDALLINVNYFDKFNFPEIEDELIPKARQSHTAILGMKALADGLLSNNAELAIRYALSADIDCLVLGINKIEYLEFDLKQVNKFIPMSRKEYAHLISEDEVLGDYVCRQCKKCMPCPIDIDIPLIFKLEGIFDRQLLDKKIRDPEKQALRELLRFWFQNQEVAMNKYEEIKVKADKCNGCGECVPHCPYNINIIDKLKICDYKLSNNPAKVY